jgi:hypothetical protein
MTDVLNQPASADAEPKKEQPLEQPKPEQVAPPASETPAEEWDKDRAMATITKLREIEKQAKKDQKEFERLKAEEQKRLEAQMTEAERFKKQADELAAQNAKLQADILRRDVIAEAGLPSALADRLKGTTKDELLADAEELKKLLPKQKTNQSVTNPSGASIEETEAQKRERLFGKNADIFDIKTILAEGGGVIFNKE